MEKDRMNQKQSVDMQEYEFDICNACSATDCTGLIPVAPQDESELDSYKDIYNFEPPKRQNSGKKTNDHSNKY